MDMLYGECPDLLFVNGFHMGIQGAAWATIISQALSAVLCLGYILLKFRDIIPEKDEWKPVEGQYSELLTTGLAMGFMCCKAQSMDWERQSLRRIQRQEKCSIYLRYHFIVWEMQ